MTKLLLLTALLIPASTVFAQEAAPTTQPAAEATIDSAANVRAESADRATRAETLDAAPSDVIAGEADVSGDAGYRVGDFNIWMTLMWVSLIGVPLVVTLFFIATVRHKAR